MKMTYVSDSVFFTDGKDYYCQIYFSPDEIVSLCPGVNHLFVVCRVRKMDPNGVYKKIQWSDCTVDFVNIEDGASGKLKQLKNTYDITKKLSRISDVSYLKFCFISSYIYGMNLKKVHKGKLYFSHMVGDPDCILAFSTSKVKKFALSVLNTIQKKCYAHIAKKMDLQIFVSNKLKEKYAVDCVKSVVVNENRFREADIVDISDIRKSVQSEPLKLLFVGRLSPEKRVSDLISALQSLQGVSLNIVGDGPQKAQLVELVQKNNLSDKISFLGRKAWGSELFSEMKKHHVLVLPSENEGLPLVIAEAMGCGLTVIASDVGGIPEIVKNEVNGLLFEKGNIEMLKAAIGRMTDDTFRYNLISEALKTARDFSFESQTKMLRNELKDILREI